MANVINIGVLIFGGHLGRHLGFLETKGLSRLSSALFLNFMSHSTSIQNLVIFTPFAPNFHIRPRVPGWMCGPSFKMVGEGVVELLIGNGFCTFDPCDLDL